jgi:hypothetical protein
MWPNPGLSLKELAELGNELYALMQAAEGATAVNIAEQPTLMRLRVAYDQARSEGSTRPSRAAIAVALRGLIEAVTYPLSSFDGASIDEGKAARIYLALEPDSGALLVKDRRKMAESYIPYEKLRSAARDRPGVPRYERRLLNRVADNLVEREFDHLDGLARLQLSRADSWSPQPHATIYKTRHSAFALLGRLLVIQGRKSMYGIFAEILNTESLQAELFPPGTEHGSKYPTRMVNYTEKLSNESYYQRVASLLTLGRLFLTVDYVVSDTLVEDQAEISRLSPRGALVNLWTAIPLDSQDVAYLTSVYVEGREQNGYTSSRSVLDAPDPYDIAERQEDSAAIEWVVFEYPKAEWNTLEKLMQTWTPWVICDCSDLLHNEGCQVATAILTLLRYIENLDTAWERLQAAITSPSPKGFAGWQDGRRLYHDLGFTLT